MSILKEKEHILLFKLTPLVLNSRKKVWQELINIPYGKTCSYLELSKN